MPELTRQLRRSTALCEFLRQQGACESARNWIMDNQIQSIGEAWDKCDNIEWLEWLLYIPEIHVRLELFGVTFDDLHRLLLQTTQEIFEGLTVPKINLWDVRNDPFQSGIIWDSKARRNGRLVSTKELCQISVKALKKIFPRPSMRRVGK